jgi:hypothetical protein
MIAATSTSILIATVIFEDIRHVRFLSQRRGLGSLQARVLTFTFQTD